MHTLNRVNEISLLYNKVYIEKDKLEEKSKAELKESNITIYTVVVKCNS
jgi:hypothetical protein